MSPLHTRSYSEVSGSRFIFPRASWGDKHLVVTNSSWGYGGRRCKAGIQELLGGSCVLIGGGQTDRQRQREAEGLLPQPSESEGCLEGQAGASRMGMSEAGGLLCDVRGHSGGAEGTPSVCSQEGAGCGLPARLGKHGRV